MLDVCGGNSFFLRNQETGVCEETRTYEATARVTLRSFQVRLGLGQGVRRRSLNSGEAERECLGGVLH